MKNLLILGAGGHAKVVLEIATLCGKWDKIRFLDDNEEIKSLNGYEVRGKISDYKKLRDEFEYAFVALGKNKLRFELVESLIENGFKVPTFIHPFSSITNNCTLGDGSITMAGVIISNNAKIGKACIINTKSNVGHDSLLGNGVHIAPGVTMGGTVNIGDYTWICLGSKVVNNINIGSNSIVAAGAVLIKDVNDNEMVAGIPAKKIRELNTV